MQLPNLSAGAEKPVVHTPTDTIHFAENAPQLAFLQIKLVEIYPGTSGRALNARLAYDDNRTARVFSPIARTGIEDHGGCRA